MSLEDYKNKSSAETKEENKLYSETPFEDSVLERYKFSASVANVVLKLLAEKCIVGASVRTLCELGDSEIIIRCKSIYKKEKDITKGVSFPTCISLNNCLCHFSPLPTDADVIIKKDDLVKIDISVHVDGYISSVATSLVVGSSKEEPSDGRKADLMMAGYTAMQYAIRMLTPGKTNHQVTEGVGKIVKCYDCSAVEGMLSHQVMRDEMFSTKVVIFNPTESMKKEYKTTEFEPYEVYSIDIFVSTSAEGRCQEKDSRTTIFRRNQSTMYDLRSKVSREILSIIRSTSPKMAFHLRNLPNLNRAKLGLKECVDHQLVSSYPVYYDREKELVVQMKSTVIITPKGPLVLTTPIFDLSKIQCEKIIQDEEINKILSTPLNLKKITKEFKQKANSTTEVPTVVDTNTIV